MLDKRLLKQLELASEQDTDTFYRKIAARDCAEKGSFTIEGAIALLGGYVGLAIVGSPIGILFGAALPVSWIAWKLWEGYEGLKAIETGDWLDRLPERERQRYLKDKAAETKALPAGQDATTAPGEPPKVHGLSVENLASTLAQSPELNALIVGRSQSGKSTFINAALEVICGKLPYILDGKPERTNTYAGLKADPNIYLAVNSKDAAMEAIARWENVLELLRKGQSGDPLPQLVVMDELNNQRLLLDNKDGKTLDEAIALFSTQVMCQGGGIWLSSHSHLVSDVGLNRQLQTSYAVIALGRNGRYSSIEAVLDDSLVIRSKVAREALKAQLTAYRDNGGNGAIAFTNLGGDDRLVVLPDYSKLLSSASAPGATHQQDEAPEWLEDELVQSESVDTVGRLNRLYQMKDAEDSRPFGMADLEKAKTPNLDSLPSELRAIAEYAAKRSGQWITARNCQREIKGFYGYSAEQVRAWFQELADRSVGQVESPQGNLIYKF